MDLQDLDDDVPELHPDETKDKTSGDKEGQTMLHYELEILGSGKIIQPDLKGVAVNLILTSVSFSNSACCGRTRG